MNASEPVGTVRALWRFPVKSMLGEGLDAADMSEGGEVGDRAYALKDRETGKVVSAKHPTLWPNMLACRAAFVEPPTADAELPVRIQLADGSSVMSDAADLDAVLSRFFGRPRSAQQDRRRRGDVPVCRRLRRRGSDRHDPQGRPRQPGLI